MVELHYYRNKRLVIRKGTKAGSNHHKRLFICKSDHSWRRVIRQN